MRKTASSASPSASMFADAARVGGEALVARQLGQPDRLAQPREQAVVADREANGRSAAS